MKKKNIFKKKPIKLKKYFIILLFIFSFLILVLLNLRQQFFVVPEFIESFYIIPENKEGKEVMNLDKKFLHLHDDNDPHIEVINNPFLEYSIQIFSSSDYDLVKEKLDFMINKNNNFILDLPLKIIDFSIVFFNNDLGKEYMLVYKNFPTRTLASDYCLKYLNFLQKCLIVNAQYLN